MHFLNYRLVIFLLVTIFGIVFSIPSFLQTDEGKKISLGLDLQGGLHMLLGVQTQKAVEGKIKSVAATVKYFSDRESILIEDLRIEPEHLSFILLDSDEVTKIDEMLAEIQGLDINKSEDLVYTIALTPIEVEIVKDMAVGQSVETIRNRLDQFGLAEPSVTRQGKTDIVVELPGIKTPQEEQHARELIAKPANLELMEVDELKADQVYDLTQKQAQDLGDVILEETGNPQVKYLVKQIPILTGSEVIDAKVAFDQQTNQPVINFTLSSFGAKVFGDFTAKSVGKRLAVVLDGKVFSAPSIRERIGGGSGQISGNFTVNEAGNVAIALRSGALPAPIIMLEKRGSRRISRKHAIAAIVLRLLRSGV